MVVQSGSAAQKRGHLKMKESVKGFREFMQSLRPHLGDSDLLYN